MTDNTNQLILNNLEDIKADIKEIKADIKELNKADGEIKERLVAIETRIDEQKSSVGKIPDLAEKVGELKNWRQIAIIVITGTVGTFLGWIARNGRL